MPDEVVAADLDFVLLGKVDEGVGVVEEILVGLGLEGAELHGVFRDDEAVLLDENAGEFVVVQVWGADGASGQEAALVGVGFEGVLAVDVVIGGRCGLRKRRLARRGRNRQVRPASSIRGG